MRLIAELSTQSTFGDEGHEGRRSRREMVHFGASLRRREGKAASVDILDLSAHGFRADISARFAQGSQVWLKLPGLEAILARVAWTDGLRIGCEFERPLHPAVLDRVVTSHRD